MIYITGDIHGDVKPLLEFINEQQLDADDTVVLLGDVGLNFYGNHQGDGQKKQKLNKRIDRMHFLMECKETLPIAKQAHRYPKKVQ